jgi:hypothetical protein
MAKAKVISSMAATVATAATRHEFTPAWTFWLSQAAGRSYGSKEALYSLISLGLELYDKTYTTQVT